MNWKIPECVVRLERLPKNMVSRVPRESSKSSSRQLEKRVSIRKHSKENGIRDCHKKQSIQTNHSSYTLYKQQRQKFLDRRNKFECSKTVKSTSKTKDSSSKAPDTFVRKTSNEKTLTSKNSPLPSASKHSPLPSTSKKPPLTLETVNSSSVIPAVNVATKKSTRTSSCETLVPDLKKSTSGVNSSIKNSKVSLKSKFQDSPSKTSAEKATTRTSAKTLTSKSKHFQSTSKILSSSSSSSNFSTFKCKTSDSSSEIINSSPVISTVKAVVGLQTKKSVCEEFPSALKKSPSIVSSPNQISSTSLKNVSKIKSKSNKSKTPNSQILTKHFTSHSKSLSSGKNIASLSCKAKTPCLKTINPLSATPATNLNKTVCICKNGKCQERVLSKSSVLLSSSKASSSTVSCQIPNSESSVETKLKKTVDKKKVSKKVYIKILPPVSRSSDIIPSLSDTSIADIITRPFTRSSSFEKFSSDVKNSSASSKPLFPKSKVSSSISETANSSVKNSSRNSISNDSKPKAACSSASTVGPKTVHISAIRKSKVSSLRYETKNPSETHIMNVNRISADFKKKLSTNKPSVTDNFAVHSKNLSSSVKSNSTYAAVANSNISCFKSSTSNLKHVSHQLSSLNHDHSLNKFDRLLECNRATSSNAKVSKCKVQLSKSKISSLKSESSVSKLKSVDSSNRIATDDAILPSHLKNQISQSIQTSDIPTTCTNMPPNSKTVFLDNKVSNSKIQDLHTKVNILEVEAPVSPSDSSIQMLNKNPLTKLIKPAVPTCPLALKTYVPNSTYDSKLCTSARTNSVLCSNSQSLSLDKSSVSTKGELQKSALNEKKKKELKDKKKTKSETSYVSDACKTNIKLNKYSLKKISSCAMKDCSKSITASAPSLNKDARLKSLLSTKISVLNKTRKSSSSSIPCILESKVKPNVLSKKAGLTFNKKRKHAFKPDKVINKSKEPIKKPRLEDFSGKPDMTSEIEDSNSVFQNSTSFEINHNIKNASINTENITSKLPVFECRQSNTKLTSKKRKSECEDYTSYSEKKHISIVKSPVKKPHVENTICAIKTSDSALQKSASLNNLLSEIQGKCQETIVVRPSKMIPKRRKSELKECNSENRDSSSVSSLETCIETQSVKKHHALCDLKATSSVIQHTAFSNNSLEIVSMNIDEVSPNLSSIEFQRKCQKSSIVNQSKAQKKEKYECKETFDHSEVDHNSLGDSHLKKPQIKECSPEKDCAVHKSEPSSCGFQNNAFCGSNYDLAISNTITNEEISNTSPFKFQSKRHECNVSYDSEVTTTKSECIDECSNTHLNSPGKCKLKDLHCENGSVEIPDIVYSTKISNSILQNAATSELNHEANTPSMSTDIKSSSPSSCISENICQDSYDNQSKMMLKTEKSECEETVNQSQSSNNHFEEAFKKCHFQSSVKISDISDSKTSDAVSQNTASSSISLEMGTSNSENMSSIFLLPDLKNKCQESSNSNYVTTLNRRISQTKEDLDSSDNHHIPAEKCPLQRLQLQNLSGEKSDMSFSNKTPDTIIPSTTSSEINNNVETLSTNNDMPSVHLSHESQNKCSEFSADNCLTISLNDKYFECQENHDNSESNPQFSGKCPLKRLQFQDIVVEKLDTVYESRTSKSSILNPASNKISQCEGDGTIIDNIPSLLSSTEHKENIESIQNCHQSVVQSFSEEMHIESCLPSKKVNKRETVYGETLNLPPESLTSTALSWSASSITSDITNTNSLSITKPLFALPSYSSSAENTLISKSYVVENAAKQNNDTSQFFKSNLKSTSSSIETIKDDNLTVQVETNFRTEKSSEPEKSSLEHRITVISYNDLQMIKETTRQPEQGDQAIVSNLLQNIISSISELDKKKFWKVCKCCSTPFGTYKDTNITCKKCDSAGIWSCMPSLNQATFEKTVKSPKAFPTKFTEFEPVRRQIAKNFHDYIDNKKSSLNKRSKGAQNLNKVKKKNKLSNEMLIKETNQNIKKEKLGVTYQNRFMKSKDMDMAYLKMPIYNNSMKCETQSADDLLPGISSGMSVKVGNQSNKKLPEVDNQTPCSKSKNVNNACCKTSVLKDKDKKQNEIKNIDSVRCEESLLEDKNKKQNEIKNIGSHCKQSELEVKKKKPNEIKDIASAHCKKSFVLDAKDKKNNEIRNIDNNDSAHCKISVLEDEDKKQKEIKNTECVSELPVIVSAYSTFVDCSNNCLEQVDDQNQEENSKDFHDELLPLNEQGLTNSHLQPLEIASISSQEHEVAEKNIVSKNVEPYQNSEYFPNSSTVADSTACTNVLYVVNPIFQNQIISYNTLQNINISSPTVVQVNNPNTMWPNMIVKNGNSLSTSYISEPTTCYTNTANCSLGTTIDSPGISSDKSLSVPVITSVVSLSNSNFNDLHNDTKSLDSETHLDNNPVSDELKIQITDVVSLKSGNCHSFLNKDSELVMDKEEGECIEEINTPVLNEFSLQCLNDNAELETPRENEAYGKLLECKEISDLLESRLEKKCTKKKRKYIMKLLSPSKKLKKSCQSTNSLGQNETQIECDEEPSNMSVSSLAVTNTVESFECVSKILSPHKQPSDYVKSLGPAKDGKNEECNEVSDTSLSIPEYSNQSQINKCILSHANVNKQSTIPIVAPILEEHNEECLAYSKEISDASESKLEQTVSLKIDGQFLCATKHKASKNCKMTSTLKELSPNQLESTEAIPDILGSHETCNSPSVTEVLESTIPEEIKNAYENKNEDLETTLESSGKKGDNVVTQNVMNTSESSEISYEKVSSSSVNVLAEDVETSTLNETISSVDVTDSMKDAQFASEPVSKELINERNSLSDTILIQSSHVNEENKLNSCPLTVQKTEQSFTSLLIHHPSVVSPRFNKVFSRNKLFLGRLLLDAFAYMAELDLNNELNLDVDHIKLQKASFNRLLKETPRNLIKLRDCIYAFAVKNVVYRCVKLFKTFENASECLLKNFKVPFTAFQENIEEDERVLVLSSLLEDIHASTVKMTSEVIANDSSEIKYSFSCGTNKAIVSNDLNGEISSFKKNCASQYETILDNDLFEPPVLNSSVKNFQIKELPNLADFGAVSSSNFQNSSSPVSESSLTGQNRYCQKNLSYVSQNVHSTENFNGSPTVSLNTPVLSNENFSHSCNEKIIKNVDQLAQNDATQNVVSDSSKSPSEVSMHCVEGIAIKEEPQESVNSSSSQCSQDDKSNVTPVSDLSSTISEINNSMHQDSATNEAAQNVVYNNSSAHADQGNVSKDFHLPQSQYNFPYGVSYSQSNPIEGPSTTIHPHVSKESYTNQAQYLAATYLTNPHTSIRDHSSVDHTRIQEIKRYLHHNEPNMYLSQNATSTRVSMAGTSGSYSFSGNQQTTLNSKPLSPSGKQSQLTVNHQIQNNFSPASTNYLSSLVPSVAVPMPGNITNSSDHILSLMQMQENRLTSARPQGTGHSFPHNTTPSMNYPVQHYGALKTPTSGTSKNNLADKNESTTLNIYALSSSQEQIHQNDGYQSICSNPVISNAAESTSVSSHSSVISHGQSCCTTPHSVNSHTYNQHNPINYIRNRIVTNEVHFHMGQPSVGADQVQNDCMPNQRQFMLGAANQYCHPLSNPLASSPLNKGRGAEHIQQPNVSGYVQMSSRFQQPNYGPLAPPLQNSEASSLSATQNHIMMFCSLCKRPPKMRCKCYKVAYCSESCAMLYWKLKHNVECRLYR